MGPACDTINLPKDEALEGAELILSMLKTLSHADARLYIGWVIRLRVSAAEQNIAPWRGFCQ